MNDDSAESITALTETNLKVQILGQKQKTRDLRRKIITELLKNPDGIAIPDLVKHLDESRPKLDVNHIPVFRKMGLIDDTILISESGRKVVGIKLKEDEQTIIFLLMFGNIFQTEYGKHILRTKKAKIHKLASKTFETLNYKKFFDANDTIFFIERVGAPYFSLFMNIDQLHNLNKISYFEKNFNNYLMRYKEQLVPQNKNEIEYYIKLKNKIMDFAEYNISNLLDEMEIVNKIEGHSSKTVKDVYLKSALKLIEDSLDTSITISAGDGI